MVYAWSYSLLVLIFIVTGFALKISSNLYSNQRRFFFYALVSMVFWGVFNFAGVNTINYSYVLMLYSLMALSISVMAGFFFLASYSFISKPKFLARLIATVPSFILLLAFPFFELEFSGYGYDLVLNYYLLMWLVSCITIIFSSVFLLMKISKQIMNRRIKRKIFVLSTSLFLMSFLFVISFLSGFFILSFVVSVPAILLSYLLFR